MTHQEAVEAFDKALADSGFSAEKKEAAKELVTRIAKGERITVVLKDLAAPLGLTVDHLMAAITPSDTNKVIH